MSINCSDESILDIHNLLESEKTINNRFDYFMSEGSESEDILRHRYVAGGAPSRCKMLNKDKTGEILAFDVALPRNYDLWNDVIDESIMEFMAQDFKMGHFACMVFHWDFVLKKGANKEFVKDLILKKFDSINAKYPAEHNVGHLYKADSCLSSHYKNLDPTNTLNPGIGKLSKNKFYKN